MARKKMICKSCGKKIPDDSLFCIKCEAMKKLAGHDPRIEARSSVGIVYDNNFLLISSIDQETIKILFDELSAIIPGFSKCMKRKTVGGFPAISRKPAYHIGSELRQVWGDEVIKYLLQNGYKRDEEDENMFYKIIEH